MSGNRFLWIMTALVGLLWIVACDGSPATNDDDDGGADLYCTRDADCDDGYICGFDGLCAPRYPDGDDDFVWPLMDGDWEEIEVTEYEEFQCGTLYLDKSIVDFQAVQVNQSSTQTFTMRNDSRENSIKISSIDYSTGIYTPEFEILTDPDDPDVPDDYVYPEGLTAGGGFTLQPGESFTVYVRYSPVDGNVANLEAGYMDEGYIQILTDACGETYRQIQLLSRMKGNKYACICVVDEVSGECVDETSPLIDFGNVDIGAPPALRTIRVRHCGDTDGNALLNIRQVALGSGVNPNFWFTSGQVGALDNVLLSPNQTHDIVIKFQPIDQIAYPDSHIEKVIIETTSDRTAERLLEVEMRGTSNDALIDVYPKPINFGVVRHTTEEACNAGTGGAIIHASVYNYTNADLRLTEYRVRSISGSSEDNQRCETVYRLSYPAVTDDNFPGTSYNPRDWLVPGETWGVPFIGVNTPVPLFVDVQYCPVGPDIRNDSDCMLTFLTEPDPNDSNVQPTRWQFAIMGEQRPVNVPPIAKISGTSHGPEITSPIRGLLESTWFNFYGDTSSDWDSRHQIKDLEWFWEELPTGVTEAMMGQNNRPVSQMRASCGGQMLDTGISVLFPKYGHYKLGLKVQDCDDDWSEPTFADIYVSGNQGLGVVLTFTPGSGGALTKNMVDMDLILQDPSGGVCRDDYIDSFNTCNRIIPPYAPMSMPASTQGADCCGHREEIRYNQPADGNGFTLAVELINDCSKWSTSVLQWNFCVPGAHHDPDWTVEIYDPRSGDFAPLKVYNGRMTDVGQRWEVRLNRVDGVWIFPQ